jgi:hypothetical protein
VDECVFCEIVAGRAPPSVVHRDDVALAIMTIGPANPGHLLVPPTRHAAYLADLDEATGAAPDRARLPRRSGLAGARPGQARRAGRR